MHVSLAESPRDGLPPMPAGPPHEERHFAAGATMREVVAGAAEGIVPSLAVGAALSLAGLGAPVVLAGGLAGLVATSVAGLFDRLRAARAEAALYALERAREEEESLLYPEREKWEVAAILHRYGVRGDLLRQAVEAVAADRRRWVDFMMRFELDLAEPDAGRAWRGSLARGLAQLAAGILPLLPYLFAPAGTALGWSCGVAALALAVLGWLRARGAGLPPLGQALGAVSIAAAAALASVAAAWLVA